MKLLVYVLLVKFSWCLLVNLLKTFQNAIFRDTASIRLCLIPAVSQKVTIMMSSVNQKMSENFKGKMEKTCFFAEEFLPRRKIGHLKQPEHNLWNNSAFPQFLQASVITELSSIVMKTVKLKHYRIFRMFPIC